MCSASGSKEVFTYGSTLFILDQKESISVTRSFITLKFPIGSIVIASPSGAISLTLVLHTNFAEPFTLIEHEPQMDARQEHLRLRVPSCSSLILIRLSKIVESSATSIE